MLPLLLLLPALFQADEKLSQDAPPGLLRLAGGPTRIGSTPADVEPLILAHEDLASTFAGETPRFTADVDDFFLMPTEVTNEQYAAFVRATGAEPPRSWGARALALGREAFLDEQAREADAAKAGGRAIERRSFDPEAWWKAHWREVEWEVPPAELAHPVVYVDHEGAERYARWAGLRLMSELEFQRAGRGDGTRTYPWGEDWDDARFCRSLHSGEDRSAPVGTYPDGAANGIHDLAGNVWEWTSSPYEPFPGYRPLEVSGGKGRDARTIDALAGFDPEQRVVVGGSYLTDKIGVRLATRRNSDRAQATNALGFRCAASALAGLDAARWILASELRPNAFADADLDPASAVALRRWRSVDGSARVAGYAVITGYDHALFCPLTSLPAALVGDLGAHGPLLLGLLSVTRPLVNPELEPGAYYVAWRPAGSTRLPEDRTVRSELSFALAQEELAEVPGFDATRDGYVFFAGSRPVAALAAPEVGFERRKTGSGVVQEGEGGVVFTIAIPSAATRAKSFVFVVGVEMEGW